MRGPCDVLFGPSRIPGRPFYLAGVGIGNGSWEDLGRLLARSLCFDRLPGHASRDGFAKFGQSKARAKAGQSDEGLPGRTIISREREPRFTRTDMIYGKRMGCGEFSGPDLLFEQLPFGTLCGSALDGVRHDAGTVYNDIGDQGSKNRGKQGYFEINSQLIQR